MPVEWSLNRWNTPHLPVVICPNAAFCYQRSKHKNIRPSPEDMTWSSAIILRKTVVSHWLKSPLCSSWKFIAAYSNFKMANCCRCRGLTRAIYILSIEHLRMLCLSRESNPGPPALQASTLWKEPFERPYLVAIRDLARFYIFCTLTGDNDQYPSLNIWLQPEYFTAENWKTAHWVCKHNKLLR
jgi:hypothetical protein